MGIDSPEMTKFNNAAPPPDFNNLSLPHGIKRINSWEIRERIPLNINNATPLDLPSSDKITQYDQVKGDARYIVEGNTLEENTLGESAGMSEVFRAWDKRMGKYVVVKRMQEWTSSYENSENWIELEAKTIAKLNHPGIPEVYDFIVADTPDGHKTPVMIMQFIESKNLDSKIKFINDKSPLEPNQISKIIYQTADTIDYMNSKGLFHSDIKPANIHLSEPHIKLIDFGVSNWVSGERTLESLGFTAPEARGDKGKRDNRSDEYSLAATTYTILFGEEPTDHVNDSFIKEFLSDSEKYSLEKYKLSRENEKKLKGILLKGLSYEPDERYQTSTEFANALSKVLINSKT